MMRQLPATQDNNVRVDHDNCVISRGRPRLSETEQQLRHQTKLQYQRTYYQDNKARICQQVIDAQRKRNRIYKNIIQLYKAGMLCAVNVNPINEHRK